MATYRANYLEAQGINSPGPVPAFQQHQVGVVTDPSHIDAFGRPKVLFGLNRITHQRIRDGHLPPRQEQMSSADILRLLAKERTTQAYRDGLEYVRAEKDFAKKEAYLYSITPSRVSGQPVLSTRLPTPDVNGVVATYPIETRVSTGLVFQRPHGDKKPPVIHHLNGRVDPVILVKQPQILRTEGLPDRVSHSTAAAYSPTVLRPPPPPSFVIPEFIPTIPGAYPAFKEKAPVPPPVAPIRMDPAGGSSSKPVLVASGSHGVASHLEAMHDVQYAPQFQVATRTPLAPILYGPGRAIKVSEEYGLTREQADRTLSKREGKRPVRDPGPLVPVPTVLAPPVVPLYVEPIVTASRANLKRVAVGDADQTPHIDKIQRMGNAPILTMTPGTKRGASEEPMGTPHFDKMQRLEQYMAPLNPGVKRGTLRDPTEYRPNNKKARVEEGVDDIRLRPLESLMQARAGTTDTPIVVPRPPQLRRLAKFKGGPQTDYATPPPFIPSSDTAPVTLRKRKPDVSTRPPAKRQKIN
ncbi:hypothetical protein HKX48_008272 [Thoreauomyces humboldtii]|nr:hypothetical protein HKX48_008272 [Thoreauomyces humboldtii]